MSHPLSLSRRQRLIWGAVLTLLGFLGSTAIGVGIEERPDGVNALAFMTLMMQFYVTTIVPLGLLLLLSAVFCQPFASRKSMLLYAVAGLMIGLLLSIFGLWLLLQGIATPSETMWLICAGGIVPVALFLLLLAILHTGKVPMMADKL